MKDKTTSHALLIAKRRPTYLAGTVFVLIVAAIGIKLLFGSHASSPYISLNADKGTLANGATIQSDSNASDGNYVQLGSTTTPPGSTVNSKPAGPAAPSSGWHVAFADGFGAPIGTGSGQDNFWYPNEGSCCTATSDHHGNNANELQAYNASQVSVDPSGLHLTMAYSPNRHPYGYWGSNWNTNNYVSGTVSTFPQYASSTNTAYTPIKPFTWTPGNGETWVFETVAKLPYNGDPTLGAAGNGADPGWWATDPPWTDEIDFFESWGWGCKLTTALVSGTCATGVAWVYDTSSSSFHVQEQSQNLYHGFDPSAAYHRYTTVIYPNNTWSEYIDGNLQTGWYGGNSSGVMPAPPYFKKVAMSIELTHAIRDPQGTNTPNPYPAFSTPGSTRTFDVRSVAVYQDGGHAGMDISGGGIAPGTTVK